MMKTRAELKREAKEALKETGAGLSKLPSYQCYWLYLLMLCLITLLIVQCRPLDLMGNLY